MQKKVPRKRWKVPRPNPEKRYLGSGGRHLDPHPRKRYLGSGGRHLDPHPRFKGQGPGLVNVLWGEVRKQALFRKQAL
jgi:hypothetical protein